MRQYGDRNKAIKWMVARDELSLVFTPEYIISILKIGSERYFPKVLMNNHGKTYIMDIHIIRESKELINFVNKFIKDHPDKYSIMYDYFIIRKSKELIHFVNTFINNHVDKYNIDIQNSFKLCVIWNCYRKIMSYINTVFLYLGEYYIKREGLSTVNEVLHNNFINQYNVSEENIIKYEDEWIQQYKARQRLLLSKIISYDIPYDLFELIAEFISEKYITRKILFKSIKIGIDETPVRIKQKKSIVWLNGYNRKDRKFELL